MLSTQLQAEHSHVLKGVVFELGGLAHDHMSLEELDTVIDNMLSKGVPNSISHELTRWIHTHRKRSGFKIQQILGTVMSDKHSLVPDCFARFFDGAAVECKVCLDRSDCRQKCKHNSSADVTVPAERVHAVYPISKRADVEDLREVISHKTGQIARTLSQGNKVTLVVSHNQLQVLTLEGTKSQEEATMAEKKTAATTKSKKAEEAVDEEELDEEEEAPKATKGKKAEPKPSKKAKEEEEDEDEDLDMEDMDEDEEDEDEDGDEDEDEEDEKPSKSKKAAKPEPKPKKEKKAAPVLNKLQQEFVDKLKTDYKENEPLFKMAKKLGVKWERKDDARIDRMLCVMAVKKHLGEQGGAAKGKSKK